MFLLGEENDGTTKSIKVGLNRVETYASAYGCRKGFECPCVSLMAGASLPYTPWRFKLLLVAMTTN
jgi:hypothetical protein